MTPLTGAAGIFDSAQNITTALATQQTAQLNFPVNGPIFAAVSWRIAGAATATVTDSAGNTYVLLLSENSGDATANSAALFWCASPNQVWDGQNSSKITLTVTTSIQVNNLWLCPFTICLPKNPVIIPGSLAGVAYLQGAQQFPSIAMTLPDQYDTVVAICYGNGGSQTASSGWKVIQQETAQGCGLFRIVPSASGAFTAQPCSYGSGKPGNVMIVFAMAPTPNLNLNVDNNGKILPAGMTVLRPFSDTLPSLLADPGWGYPFCTGMTIRMRWADIQPNPPTGNPAVDYNWSYIDGALAQAQTTGKFIGMIMGMGPMSPPWLLSSFINLFSIDQGTGLVPAPWDINYQNVLLTFIKALAQRYDSNPNLAYISISGFGWQTGMAFCRSTNDNSDLFATTYRGVSGLNLLYAAFQTISQMWMAAFQKTRLVVDFYGPIYPNNTTTETTLALPWMQWLLGIGPVGQVGTKYNNWNTSLAPQQDIVPAQLARSIQTTTITAGQPQHSTPSDWPAVFQSAITWGVQIIEGYAGQVAADVTAAPGGANWQYTCMMLAASAKTTRNFSPFVPPPGFFGYQGGVYLNPPKLRSYVPQQPHSAADNFINTGRGWVTYYDHDLVDQTDLFVKPNRSSINSYVDHFARPGDQKLM